MNMYHDKTRLPEDQTLFLAVFKNLFIDIFCTYDENFFP